MKLDCSYEGEKVSFQHEAERQESSATASLYDQTQRHQRHHERGQQKPTAWSGGTSTALQGWGRRPPSFLSSQALLCLAGPRFQKPQGAGLDRHRVGRECASWALPSLGRRPGKRSLGRLGGAPQRGCTVKAHRSPGGSVRAVEATAA